MDTIVILCSRCGMPCKLAATATEDARLLRHATKPETSGYCPDCAVADFFQNKSPFGQIIKERGEAGRQMLLDPRVQERFAGVMQAGNADAQPDEINWQRVYEHWDVPFPKKKRAARRKQSGTP